MTAHYRFGPGPTRRKAVAEMAADDHDRAIAEYLAKRAITKFPPVDPPEHHPHQDLRAKKAGGAA